MSSLAAKKNRTIHKKELIAQVADRCSVGKDVVGDVISTLQDVVLENINNNRNININGFMSFRCVTLAQRISYNYVDGDKVIYPPVKRVSAVISESFQRKIEQEGDNE